MLAKIPGRTQATDRLAILCIDGEQLISSVLGLMIWSEVCIADTYLVLHRLESDFDHFEWMNRYTNK
jgi:hypothetical protein